MHRRLAALAVAVAVDLAVRGCADPAIPSEEVAGKGWPAGVERPRRYLDGRLFSLGGVPDGGDQLALAASSSGGPGDGTGGLFVLRHDGRSWRVTGEERHWVT